MEVEIIGKKVVKLRPMTKREMTAQGWEYGRRSCVIIELEGGIKLYASRDEEGNGPGALFGTDKEGSFILG